MVDPEDIRPLIAEFPSAAATVRLAVAFGLGVGLIDSAWLAATTHLFHQHHAINPDSVWMAPIANVGLFGATALLVILLRWRRFPLAPTAELAVFSVLASGSVITLVGGVHWVAGLLLAVGLGLQTARTLSRRGVSTDRAARLAAPALMAVTIGIAAISVVGPAIRERRALAALAPATGGRPNILLLILDTVRAANLGLYGYSRPTTPELERLAQSAIVFDLAVSPSSWTMPSHASMFTGRSPHELTADWQAPLDRTFPTVAEALAANGYVTAGFVANAYYAGRSAGLDRGFAHFEDYRSSVGELLNGSSLGSLIFGGRVHGANRLGRLIGNDNIPGRRRADQVRRAFVEWLGRRPTDRPFFAFLNYLDAHAPYDPPASLESSFRLVGSDGQPDPMGAYDAAIAYLDSEVGLLRRELAAEGLDHNTVVIITADHGELFGEHQLRGHGNALYLDQLHVPLLVSLPSGEGAGTRIESPVTLTDFPATALELAGISTAPTLGTRSWSRFWSSATPDSQSVAISEIRAGVRAPRHEPVARGDMVSVLGLGYHYIRNGDGIEELYHLAPDPQELTNLALDRNHQSALDRLRSLAPAGGWKPRR